MYRAPYSNLWQRIVANTERRVLPDGFECWEHQAGLNKAGGYPRISVRREGKHKKVYPHREMFRLANGSLPAPRHEVDHICHNHRCCNPDHLRSVPTSENRRNFWRLGVKNA
jgi:HNH endonuclease